VTPLSSRAPCSSGTKSPATWRWTFIVTSTEPGSAAAWTPAATFGASPNTSPFASTTIGPDSRPIRAESSGAFLAEFLELIPARACWIARAAHGPLRVVLLRLRIAEEGDQPVAKPLQHMAAQPGHCR
jgi:hypothetical protein